MTIQELAIVMQKLESYYKNFFSGTEKEKILHDWYPYFREDDVREVNRAVMIYTCTSTFAPTIAGIKMLMAEYRQQGQKTEMEAWQDIRTAVENSGTRRDAVNEYSKLSPIIQKVVGSPSQLTAWRKVSDDTFEGVIASNIQRSYRELAKREAAFYAIPNQMRETEGWRIDGPQNLEALPAPEGTKSVDDILRESYEGAAAGGMTMTEELREKNAAKVEDFLKPVTKAEKKLVEERDRARQERYL